MSRILLQTTIVANSSRRPNKAKDADNLNNAFQWLVPAIEAYQQQTDLVGLSVVFDSADTGDLSQRLQWSTTIFAFGYFFPTATAVERPTIPPPIMTQSCIDRIQARE